MSSKIAKFISSALNNSSANEAAQALKMAAATMQKEGLNPAEFLQRKGDGASDAALIERLKSERAFFESSAQTTKKMYEDAQRKIRELENRATGAFNAGQMDSVRAELKEAKQLAIKWCKDAEEKGKELELSLEFGSRYQKGYIDMQDKRDTLQTYVKWLGGMLACACIFSAVQMNKVNDLETANYSLRADNTNLHQQVVSVADQDMQELVNKPPVDTDSATCKIQGKVYDNQTKRYVVTKFIYQDGVVTTYTNGKIQGTDKEVSRERFLSNVNREFPGKADCKLGVINS